MTALPKVKKGFRGYCTHNAFGGFQIPVPVQNLLFRDYVAREKLTFNLSVNELYFPDCFLNLEHLLRELPTLEGILMASALMLPQDTSKRNSIYESVLSENSSIHFVMENMILEDEKSRDSVENLFLLNSALLECPDRIDSALLEDLGGRECFTS